MKLYILSLLVGILVGTIYALLNVRSPAPPIVALIGLLGILVGEQLVPVAINFWKRETGATSWSEHVKPHMFGELAKGARASKERTNTPDASNAS
ncbi:XapX domain-containing protein [Pararhizobium sp. PWRC1-1]|uniref:XapX domain-containing protein n=1 Tax=Pararhizobium sp. PWRC1-1 TaxID=2804566 RepID=UPI003CF4C689